MPKTWFEQQVADALLAALPISEAVDEWWWRDRIREMLAPRVAAAIEAAGVRVAEILLRDLPADDVSWHGEPEKAALAALRGGPA